MKCLKLFIIFSLFSTIIYSQNNVSAGTDISSTYSKVNTGFNKGIYTIIETGYEKGLGEFATDRIKLNFTTTYFFSPVFSLGIGSGIRYYFRERADSSSDNINQNEIIVPVYTDIRANFNQNKNSPYFSLNFGYSFNASASFEGVGLIIAPNIGYRIKYSEKFALFIAVGYEAQIINTEYFTITTTYNSFSAQIHEKKENAGALCFNIGILF